MKMNNEYDQDDNDYSMNNPSLRATRRDWLGLAALTMVVLVLSTDLTALFLAMPSITADLQPGPSQMLWILHIYGFFIGGFLITMGRLGDRIGRRRILVAGAAAFAVFSVIAAFSNSAEMLIGARALLGVAGATLMPSTFSLLRGMFHDDGQRRFAIAVIFSAFSAGGALGPLLGGILLELFWWGAVFLINVPVLIVFLVTAPMLLPEYREVNVRKLDWVSVVLSLGGVLLVIFGIQGMAFEGGGLFLHAMAVVAGITVVTVFVRRQRNLTDPLLDLKLFKNRLFSTSLIATFVTLIGLSGVFYLFTQYLQWVEELSPVQAGMWTVPYVIANIAGAMAAPWLSRLVHQEKIIWISLLLVGFGLALIAAGAGSLNLSFVVISISIAGLAQGSAFALVSDLILSSAPPEKAGSAAAMQEMSGEMGSALGVALLGTVGMFVYRFVLSDSISAEVPTQVAESVIQSVAGASPASDQLSVSMSMELLLAAQHAFSQAFQVSSGLGAILVIALALIVRVLLKRTQEAGELHLAVKETRAGGRKRK